MRVAFVHPDLGIGGAERLVVDAARSLQARGHQVVIFTCHHDSQHCFEETQKDLPVEVHGDFLPRHLFGMFHLLCAALRNLYLSLWLYLFCPQHYDIILVDQIPYCIPILRTCCDKIVYYCHFPDKFLAPAGGGILRKMAYRRWFDWWEEKSMQWADLVLVNSNFTAEAYARAFPHARLLPSVLYPGVDCLALSPSPSSADEGSSLLPWIKSHRVVTSLNRFERKKDVGRAIKVLDCILKSSRVDKLLLVIAGGYDRRVRENVDYLVELRRLCDKMSLSHTTLWPDEDPSALNHSPAVVFMPSVTASLREQLLRHSRCLVYTPQGEHFGIGPVEAMATGTPVIAMNSGGPRETVISGETGFLCQSNVQEIADKVILLLNDEKMARAMGEKARKHVADKFSIHKFGDNLENYLFDLLK